MAKVDVLLPYWGDFKLLKKAVESVLAQTEKDWHLYIFDDAYPSNEPSQFFSNLKDSRISYYRHKENVGITKNFNYAVANASSPHCVLLGCDDVMLPSYLERALEKIGEADFYQPGVEVIDEQGRPYLPLGDRVKRLLQPKQSRVLGGERLAISLCTGNWLYFPSILWKTATIRNYGFDEKYKIVEDVVLEMNIILDGGSMYFDKETTFQYRRSAASLSSKEKAKGGIRFKEEDIAYTYLAKRFADRNWQKASLAAKVHLTSRMHRLIP